MLSPRRIRYILLATTLVCAVLLCRSFMYIPVTDDANPPKNALRVHVAPKIAQQESSPSPSPTPVSTSEQNRNGDEKYTGVSFAPTKSSFPLPNVVIAITAGERLSKLPYTVKAVRESSSYPFKLLVVATGVPPSVYRWLLEHANQYNFQIQTSPDEFTTTQLGYLSPQQLRIIAVRNVDLKNTDYVIFIDGDAEFKLSPKLSSSSDWVRELISPSSQHRADIIGPWFVSGDVWD